MVILKRLTGERLEVFVALVSTKDFTKITKKRFSFNWRTVSEKCQLYKLKTLDDIILGVMAIIEYPEEERVEIELVAVSSRM